MSIASEITRINNNIAAAYTALDGKGATLPATQNSANLADTIDSITVGGGGTDAFEQLKSKVNSIPTTYTYNDAISDGFTVTNYGSSAGNINLISTNNTVAVVVKFSNDFKDKLTVGNKNARIRAIIASEGAIITDLESSSNTNGDYFQVDFSNASEKFIAAIREQVTNGFLSTTTDTSKMNTGYYIERAYSRIEELTCTLISSTYTQENPANIVVPLDYPNNFINRTLFSSTVLRSIKISNNFKICLYNSATPSSMSASRVQYMTFPSKVFDYESFINDCTNYEYGVSSLSATATSSILKGKYKYLSKCSKFPFVLDGSNMTDNGTWYVSSASDYYYNKTAITGNGSCPYEWFIIPPDMDIEWLDYSGDADSTFISPRSLAFLAENSPNVTSRTLKIGQTMLNLLQEQYPTVYNTLTSKGWTVAAS